MAAAARIAGKALNEFLGAIGRGTEQYVVSKLIDKATQKPSAAPSAAQLYMANPYVKKEEESGTRGKVGRFISSVGPENVAKAAGYAVPLTLAAAYDAIGPQTQSSARSQFSLPVQQQYEAASALEQQKFEHQMAIIQARQLASADRAAYGMTPNMVDPMSIANQMFKSQDY